MPTRRCGGFALPVALVVVVAISLAAARMVRAVDTTTAVAGNLALRVQTMATAELAIEQALGVLEDPGAIPDREHDLAARGYHAWRLPGEGPPGIPRALQGSRVDSSIAGRQPDANDAAIAHVIERLCLAQGPALAPNCVLAPISAPQPPSSGGGTPATEGVPVAPGGAPAPGTEAAVPATAPIYRVTVRVDGPRGTIVIAQAHILGGMPARRLSWRIVAE